MAYAICRTVQRFEKLRNCDEPLAEGDLGLRYDIILTPRHGVKVIFTE